MEIGELNEKYFGLYGDLYYNRSLLTSKQYEVMSKALYTEYAKELEVVVGDKSLKVGRSVFELRFKLRNYLPHRRLFFWWNKTAKMLLQRYKTEFLEELKRLLEGEKTECETLDTETESHALTQTDNTEKSETQ